MIPGPNATGVHPWREVPIGLVLGARQAADRAQALAAAAMGHAVLKIRASGYTSRDAGMLLGVSNQRISQIERQVRERGS